MIIAILVVIAACAIFWLVFLKFKLVRLTPGWGIVFAFFVIHLCLVFVIGLRFVTPASTNATIVQHTVQLVPRLPEPTLVTEVLVEENVPVQKDQPLFQFDRRPYEYKVEQLEAQLVQAQQNVNILRSDVDVAANKLTRMEAELEHVQYLKAIFDRLARERSVKEDAVEDWLTRLNTALATRDEAQAELANARFKYVSDIGGVNTTVANVEAQLNLARYYLDNTTLKAPEEGRIINLQVRPGMVSGIYRIGGIAAFIASADRYLLATFYQENLKYVQPGQPVEVSFDLYPDQVFAGRLDSIWQANGVGQYLPGDEIPKFQQRGPNIRQGQYAVKINLDDPDQSKFPLGAQGSAAIYTGGEHGACLRALTSQCRGFGFSQVQVRASQQKVACFS